MPCRLIWENQGVRFVFEGYVTTDEVNEANAAFYKDPRSDRVRYQISDNRRITGYEWDPFEINKIAAFDKGASESLRKMQVAIICVQEEDIKAAKHYIQMSKRLNSSWQFAIFDDLPSAHKWLGVD